MATEVRSAINVVRHDNHIPPATLTAREFVRPAGYSLGGANFLMISNSSAITIYVSFDGSSLFTVKSGGVFSINFANQKYYWTKGDAAASIEVLIGSEV